MPTIRSIVRTRTRHDIQCLQEHNHNLRQDKIIIIMSYYTEGSSIEEQRAENIEVPQNKQMRRPSIELEKELTAEVSLTYSEDTANTTDDSVGPTIANQSIIDNDRTQTDGDIEAPAVAPPPPAKEPHSIVGNKDQQPIILYARRWLVLASFSIMSLISAWVWITWSPFATLAADYWGVSLSAVDQLAAVYLWVYVPGSLIALWLVVHKLGLRGGLWISGILNLVGALLRVLGVQSYPLVYAGSFLCAVAQTFSLSTPPLIAGLWFGEEERATATALGVLANMLGTALGLGATIITDFADENGELDEAELISYLWLQVGVSVFALLIVVVFIRTSAPPTPPSSAAAALKDDSSDQPTYIASVLVVFRDAPIFVILYGLSIGVFYTIPAFLSQYVSEWSSSSAGWLGIAYQMSGVIGCFACGSVLDKYPRYKRVSFVLLVTTALSLLLFDKMLESQSQSWIFVATCGVGFSLAAMNAAGFEYGTALTYPADEAAVAGILESSSQLAAFIFVTANTSLLALLLVVSAAVLLLCFIKADTKRPRRASRAAQIVPAVICPKSVTAGGNHNRSMRERLTLTVALAM